VLDKVFISIRHHLSQSFQDRLFRMLGSGRNLEYCQDPVFQDHEIGKSAARINANPDQFSPAIENSHIIRVTIHDTTDGWQLMKQRELLRRIYWVSAVLAIVILVFLASVIFLNPSSVGNPRFV